MELNTSALLGFRTRYETLFNQAFNLAEPQIQKFALVMDTGRVEQVTHRWLAGIQGMREFTDARQINNVDNRGFTLKNKIWEDTIAIQRVELERDQYKLYDPLVARLGQTAKMHRDKLGFEMLSDALATPASYDSYDGDHFYGTHSTGRSTSYTNSTTGALTEITLQAGIASLRNRRDTKGNPLQAAVQGKPLLAVPPALEFTASKLANLSFLVGTQPGTGVSSATSQAGATENILKGTFDYIVVPWLKTSTEWHLTISDNLFKPLLFQVEQEIEMLSWDKFLAQWSMYDQFVIGVRGLYNIGVALPELAYGSTGAA